MAKVNAPLLAFSAGEVSKDALARVDVEKLRLATVHVDETPALTAGEIRLRARRHARAVGKLGLIERATATDISPGMVRVAQRNAEGLGFAVESTHARHVAVEL